jgi:hypothetical protein
MRKLTFIRGLMILLFTLTGLNSCTPDSKISAEQEKSFILAAKNGELVNKALTRSKRYADAWVPYADPKTGLIPNNIFKNKKNNDIWDVANAAADNYPFMVLTSSFTDTNLFKGRMLEITIPLQNKILNSMSLILIVLFSVLQNM